VNGNTNIIGGTLGVGVTSVAANYEIEVRDGNNATGFLASNSSGGYAAFGLDSAATSDARIRWTNTLYFGEVGSEKLSIAGSGAATFSSTVAGTSFTANNRTILGNGFVGDLSGAGNNIGIVFGAGILYSSNGDGSTLTPKHLGDASNPWGNIFAGAATFSSSVTANGAISTTTGFIYTNAGALFAQASGTEGASYQLNGITIGYSATGTYGWITAGGASARTALALNAGGGNVLIGTTTDNGVDKLQVNGSARVNGNLLTTGIAYMGGTNTYIFGDNTDLYLGTGGNARLTIASTGAATFSSTISSGSITANSGNRTLTFDNITNYGQPLVINSAGSLPLYLQTNGTNALTIASNQSATFSSSVTAADDIRVLSGNVFALNRPDNGASSEIYTNASNELILSTAIGGTMTLGTGATFSSTITTPDTLSWGTAGNKYMYGTGGTQKFAYTISQHNIVYSGGTTGFSIYNSADTAYLFRIVDSGAATFSSSVTAVSLSLTTGNFNLGTSSNAGVVNMYNASTVPSASITNGVILYAQDVDPGTGASSELKVRDEAGNITTLSPHNFSLIPNGPSEELAWSYYSEKKGKKINVDMLKLARLVESLTDEQLVYIQ
jgi:hypothetical protein